jgi:hypothetical protein
MNNLWKIGCHAMINIGGVTSMIFFVLFFALVLLYLLVPV